MTSKLTFILSVLFVGLAGAGVTVLDPSGEAPRPSQPAPGRWSTGVKQGVGTSYESYDSQNRFSEKSSTAPISHVWYTAAQGILTEVFWPTIDTAQIRDSQFLVTDGSTFFFEERKNSVTQVEWAETGVPAYRIRNRDPQGRFEIERTLFSDPDRDVVLQHIRIRRNQPGLQFYYLHNPQVANTPLGNSALANTQSDPASGTGPGLFAWQDQQSQAVVFSVPMRKASAGFFGSSDGYQDLSADLKMDYQYHTAKGGKVVLMAWLDLPESKGESELDIAIGFGTTIAKADQLSRQALSQDWRKSLDKFSRQWRDYQDSLDDLSPLSTDSGRLYRSSIAVLKTSEDKTYEGGIVASPTVPWGEHHEDWSAGLINGTERADKITGGYHVVWPRDLYQIATSFLAVGDTKTAVATLNFLKHVQYKNRTDEWVFGPRHHAKNGGFPQNCWVNGEVFWPGLQMDEIAFPLILAYRLWKLGLIEPRDYWDMVRNGADFIQEFGPWSPQERWEENFGASPSTIASMIAALWTSSEFAHEMGDLKRANSYQVTGDSWSSKPGDNIDTWTFTTTGPYANGRYYLRIEGARDWDQIWNPNDDAYFELRNGAGWRREKEITDAGFLELVRLGVKSALDRNVLETLPVIDQTIRKDLPGIGPGFYRYVGDLYNYDDLTGQQTRGMVWPFLTGERGHFELAKALEQGESNQRVQETAHRYIVSMEKMATPQLLLPEQIWDAGPAIGKPTGAATPLNWTHAEYIKLLRSARDGKIFDQIPYVKDRATALRQALGTAPAQGH